MRTYLISLASGDTVQSCAQFTAAGKRRKERELWSLAPEVDRLPCEQALPIFRTAYDDLIRDPKLTSLRIGARRATGVGPGSERFVAVKNGGVWKLAIYG